MILVFGSGGQLGQELVLAAGSRGIPVTGLSRIQADVADAAAVEAAIAAARPSLVVNAGAYTKVDKAETDEAEAFRANATGPGILGRACAAAGVPLVHVSTDYVFDGSQAGAYRESDPIAPLGVYGRSKAAGEAALREAGDRHLILRTSWVYGVHGANFLKTMLRLAADRDELRVVADQRGCPTSTLDLAEAILHAAARIRDGQADFGTYHLAGQGVTTWHGFASRIVAAQAPLTGRTPRVVPITTPEYPTPAKRPANSELDSRLFAQTFGYTAKPWEDRTDEAVRALVA
ncbi:MAG: dTDP-4-dehydrorhamnose reductase [Microvirga sp.]